MTPDFIIVAALVLLFGLLLQHFVLRHILTYQLTEGSVRVVLFGTVPLSSTSYGRIEEIRQVTWAEAWRYPHAWRAANRLNGPFVLIHRKWGLPVVITPEDPDGFVRELRERVYHETGEWPLVS